MVVLAYTVTVFSTMLVYDYSLDSKHSTQYFEFFSDSVKSDIDTVFNYTYSSSKGIYQNYHYKWFERSVFIWEFYNIDTTSFDKTTDEDLLDTDFWAGEVINKNGCPSIKVRFLHDFKKSIRVLPNDKTKIIKTLSGANYTGILANADKLMLCNNAKIPQIILSFSYCKNYTAALLYKKSKKNILVIITSENAIDESVIGMLNLK